MYESGFFNRFSISFEKYFQIDNIIQNNQTQYSTEGKKEMGFFLLDSSILV